MVEEQGTHNELMELKGLYHSLVTRQLTGKEEEYDEKRKNRAEAEVENGGTEKGVKDVQSQKSR